MLKEEAIYLEAPVTPATKHYQKEELFIQRFYSDEKGPPVLMIHGSVENGKIFYSSSGKGIAPYLAQKGYDVFVVDMRGRGKSKPPVSKHSKFGSVDIIETDFPLYVKKIKELKGDVPQHWMGHSWGGVLILAYLAKHFKDVKIASMVFFATKRSAKFNSFRKIFKIYFLWNILGKYPVKQKGYFDAIQLRVGADNESKGIFNESREWVKNKKWKDPRDQFDYAAALRKLPLPPTLNLIGSADVVLCHPKDIEYMIKETGAEKHRYKIIGKTTGFRHDYGHNDILTHKDATDEVYPLVLEYLKKHEKQS